LKMEKTQEGLKELYRDIKLTLRVKKRPYPEQRRYGF
jgi:hypothetical protein